MIRVMLLAFLVRIVLPQVFPGAYPYWIHLAAPAWTATFAILGFRLVPRLPAPRWDGREH